MKIDQTGPLGTTPARRRDKAASARPGEFAKHVPGEPAAATAPVAGNAPVSAVNAVLALQEVEDSTSEQANAKGRARGELLLERLDEIRHGLLLGRIPRHTLDDLARAARAKRATVTSPQLTEVLDEIELRAEVELAKFDRGT